MFHVADLSQCYDNRTTAADNMTIVDGIDNSTVDNNDTLALFTTLLNPALDNMTVDPICSTNVSNSSIITRSPAEEYWRFV